MRHYSYSHAPVAQWIEHWFPEPGVAGSIPAGRAILPMSSHMHRISLFIFMVIFCFSVMSISAHAYEELVIQDKAHEILACVAIQEDGSTPGAWRYMPNGCADHCGVDPDAACFDALTLSCDCGPDHCWDQETLSCLEQN